MVAITNGQLELAGTLVVGDGTQYTLPSDFIQWWTAPEVRTGDQARGGSDGYQPGRDLLGKHTTTIVVQILADSEAEMGDLIDAWKVACQVVPDDLVTLRSNLLGQERLRYGRFRLAGDVQVSGWSLVQRSPLDPGSCERLIAQGSAQFVVFDSRTYSDELHSESTGRVVAGSGFTPPFLVPFTLGAASGGTLSAVNAGNRSAPWSARLAGPLAFPAITHIASGRRLYLALTANGGVDLAPGQYIDFDSSERSVLLNGEADRRMNLTIDSDWWELEPGSNTFQLDADSGSGTLTVAWRDAYLS